MSKGIVCDQCGETLVLNSRGDDEMGEIAGWGAVELGDLKADVCSRSCAHEWLDREDVVKASEAWQETIAEIAAVVRGSHSEDSDD